MLFRAGGLSNCESQMHPYGKKLDFVTEYSRTGHGNHAAGLGLFGETLVTKRCACPKCKRSGTLVRLPVNFKCADLICDFCGFLAQVKAATSRNVNILPQKVMGAAWGRQKARMEAGIYFPLYLVLVARTPVEFSIFYLSADLQPPELFEPRTPLSKNARRAGWQGFTYDLRAVSGRLVRLLYSKLGAHGEGSCATQGIDRKTRIFFGALEKRWVLMRGSLCC